MEIYFSTLENTDLQQLYDVFMEAFANFRITRETNFQLFESMLRDSQYDPKLSIGAFESGSRSLIGFVLNRMETGEGSKTAYAILVGTKPSWRRQGVMSRIFEQVLPLLREQGVQVYYTETKKNNQPAIGLYRKQGFQIAGSVVTEVNTVCGTRSTEQYRLVLQLPGT